VKAYDVIMIGAGGAGLMCAAEAGKRGQKVLLLDHCTVLGRKILISGGGRCNFTNTGATAANYFSANPHFCKSALSKYTPDDFIALVKKHGIAFHEKKLGQLFCDGPAQAIVDMLSKECQDAGVELRINCVINSIGKNEKFIVDTSHGAFAGEKLVIATGGLSIPKIGATGFGYKIAEQFGLKIVKTAPALVGFNLGEPELAHLPDLTGVSVDSDVSCNGASFRENILFTHTGLSGPAILQASLYWNPNDYLEIDTLPGKQLSDELLRLKKEGTKSVLKNVLSDFLPKRFAEKFCELYLENQVLKPLNQFAEKDLEEAARKLHNWHILPRSSLGYMKAEVTRGGVDTNELSSKTMDAKKVPGLYFIGEVVDVTGQLGGYNFQWAWASAVAAAGSM
jgi:predicted Rossmann fold flavoprotein